jgi:hypothetical protein
MDNLDKCEMESYTAGNRTTASLYKDGVFIAHVDVEFGTVVIVNRTNFVDNEILSEVIHRLARKGADNV